LPDGTCQLFDYGPEFFMPIPTGDTTSKNIFLRSGFQTCTFMYLGSYISIRDIPTDLALEILEFYDSVYT
jgi:hypothetical protein